MIHFPNPNVLDAFLDEYKNIRDKTLWNEGLQKLIAQTLKTLVNMDIQGDRISEINSFKYRFRQAQTVSDWIEIIFELSRKAKEAQAQVYTGKESLFSQFLHAIRSYIIAMLKYTPRDTHSNETSLAFNEVIKKLTQEKDKAIGELLIALHNGSDRLHIEELKTKRNLILLKLVDLNDEPSIFTAEELGLLSGPGYKYLSRQEKSKLSSNADVNQSININIPLQHQLAFYYIFYERIVFDHTRISFKQFLSKANKNTPTHKPIDLQDILIPDPTLETEDSEEDISLPHTHPSPSLLMITPPLKDEEEIEPEVKKVSSHSPGRESIFSPTRQRHQPNTENGLIFEEKERSPSPSPH